MNCPEGNARQLVHLGDETGALLVADDSGNTVWRVSAAHPQVTQR
jgi:hypothetical protein